MSTRPAIAIHGGCGVMAKLGLTEEEWAAARADLGPGQQLAAGQRDLRDHPDDLGLLG